MTGRVAGKVALVTGGASGLGRASAAALAREGALTYVADLDEAAGLAHCAQITAAGGAAYFIRLDVTDEASWTTAIATIAAKSGTLDILLNNAGICILKPLSAFSLADWRRLMAVNLDGVFLGTRAALSLLGEGSGGSIINMSSAAGKMAAPMMAAYSASKGSVIMFTRAMALECAQLGLKIRVNAICPGGVATPLWAKLTNDGYLPDAGVTTEDMAEKRRWTEAITPIGFAGEPEDIAHGVIYLASDEARFVTGTELVIDGGNTLPGRSPVLIKTARSPLGRGPLQSVARGIASALTQTALQHSAFEPGTHLRHHGLQPSSRRFPPRTPIRPYNEAIAERAG